MSRPARAAAASSLAALALLVCPVVAHAEVAPADIACGSTISWDLERGPDAIGNPDGVEALIAKTWAAIGPVAKLKITRVSSGGTVRYEFANWGQGQHLSDQIMVDGALVTVQHSSETADLDPVNLQTVLLRDALIAVGVSAPSSVGAVLSQADRAALVAVCAVQAAPPVPTDAPSGDAPVSGDTGQTAGLPGTQNTDTPTAAPAHVTTGWHGVAGLVHKTAVVLAGVLALLLAVFLAPGIGGRKMLDLGARVRARLARRDTKVDPVDPEVNP